MKGWHGHVVLVSVVPLRPAVDEDGGGRAPVVQKDGLFQLGYLWNTGGVREGVPEGAAPQWSPRPSGAERWSLLARVSVGNTGGGERRNAGGGPRAARGSVGNTEGGERRNAGGGRAPEVQKDGLLQLGYLWNTGGGGEGIPSARVSMGNTEGGGRNTGGGERRNAGGGRAPVVQKDCLF